MTGTSCVINVSSDNVFHGRRCNDATGRPSPLLRKTIRLVNILCPPQLGSDHAARSARVAADNGYY